ncbi:hypothetical protein ATO7_11678 [Oceanococcus atlanticus]|uniref:Uncharacterized protein n=1 Tax=Oceanococcus atlanticus TaxID=1317117 RepID=A0A1Y1SBF0_9GAMM|nr:hypothetical protein [Oceanococcus atlanticus]ORE85951.1 hypothetical protein ATO7_11678 [Oceanococcus atlanticus]
MRFIVLVSFLCLISIEAYAESVKKVWVCETEGYIVEKQAYFFDHNAEDAVGFAAVPSWVPEDAQAFLRKARNLPINASHQDIVASFSDMPQFKYSGGVMEKYTWNVNQADQYRVIKYKGCISQLVVFLRDFNGKSVYLNQENRVADSGGYGGKPKKGDCAYRTLHEAWAYLVDGKYSKNYSERPPLDLVEIDRAFDGYNRRREVMKSKVGEPEVVDGKHVWEIEFGGGQLAQISLSVTDNCVTDRVVSWKGQDGLIRRIVGKFEYRNKQEREWYIDALDLVLRAWSWFKTGWAELTASFK